MDALAGPSKYMCRFAHALDANLTVAAPVYMWYTCLHHAFIWGAWGASAGACFVARCCQWAWRRERSFSRIHGGLRLTYARLLEVASSTCSSANTNPSPYPFRSHPINTIKNQQVHGKFNRTWLWKTLAFAFPLDPIQYDGHMTYGFDAYGWAGPRLKGKYTQRKYPNFPTSPWAFNIL